MSLVLGRLQRYRERAWSIATARDRLRATEGALGRRLPGAVWREVRAYAHDALGDGRYAFELARYALVAEAFRPGWIPDAFMAHAVIPHVNPLIAPVARLRTLAPALLPGVRSPRLLSLVHGAWIHPSGDRLSAAAAHALLFADAAEVVMKDDGTAMGRGLRLVRRGDDLAALAARGANAVFQRRVAQHPVFDAFVPGGATTLRVVTVHLPATTGRAGVEVRAARLQIPAGGGWFVAYRQRIDVAVDVASGFTHPLGRDRDFRPFPHHPDTGAPFARFAVPGFIEAIDACRRWHEALPWAGLLGWDLMIDPQGLAWVVECNGRYPALTPTEPVTGPAFADLGFERLRPPRERPVSLSAGTGER